MAMTHQQHDDVQYLARHIPKGLELGLRNYWYPVLQSEDLVAGQPLGFRALGETLVAWRGRDGAPNVVFDRCSHRAAKLSLGRVLAGDLQCALHGLRFNGRGECTLIPWEDEDSPLRNNVGVTGYPAREIGGWIYAYIGDPQVYPPPPLEDVIPEELLKPDEFIVFRHPIDVWKCNWLQALDGSDGFHAVMLHSESQPVAKKDWHGGAVERPAVKQEDRRMKVLDTPQGLRGVAYDPAGGDQLHHGHFLHGWKGERWTLPCLFSLPLAPAPNVPPYVARLYQFPIDATHTQCSRWVAMRASTDAERDRCRHFYEEIIGPRQRKVMSEDKVMSESIGDLAETRNAEHLFAADRDVVTVRRMMADAWLAQHGGSRPTHGPDAMAFPV